MRKSLKSRSDSSTSSSIAAERLADYRGDCSNSAAATSSASTAVLSPNLSPSDCGNKSETLQGNRSSTSALISKANMSHDSCESLLCNQLEQTTVTSSREASKVSPAISNILKVNSN